MYSIDTVKLICDKDAGVQDVIEIQEPADMSGTLVPVLFSSFQRKFTLDFTFGQPGSETADIEDVIAHHSKFVGEGTDGELEGVFADDSGFFGVSVSTSTDRRLTPNLTFAENNSSFRIDSAERCEHFFLFANGGDAASLPDTWLEARQIFANFCGHVDVNIKNCEWQSASIFRGLSNDDAFEPNENICTALTSVASEADHWFDELGGRRLKSGSSRFGYSAGSMVSRFRPGYRKTAYGVAGVAVIGGGFFLARGSLHHAPGSQKFRLLDEETKLSRYDFLVDGFDKADYTWPLRLVVTNLEDHGQFNDPSLCSGTRPVQLPKGRIFFALSKGEHDKGKPLPGWAIYLMCFGGAGSVGIVLLSIGLWQNWPLRCCDRDSSLG